VVVVRSQLGSAGAIDGRGGAPAVIGAPPRPAARSAAGKPESKRTERQLTGSEVWPEESLEAIHEASLQLLERAGLRVLSGEVRDVLVAAGCTPGAGDRVLVPRRVVEQALATCPASFDGRPRPRP
jgi:trimethylamine--corrinoid protein Co-methyltransferase